MMQQSLTFREDSSFTIVQFTDIHWSDEGEHPEIIAEANSKSRNLMKQVLQAEKPDLVVLTGDIISAGSCQDPAQSFRNAVSVVEESGIPWAVVFGNHDTEKHINREQLMDVVRENAGSLTEPGPDGIGGCGNYVLKITDAAGRTAAALYFLDTGNTSNLSHVEGYDWVRRGQIDWYEQQSRALTGNNNGVPIPSLAFFHIPLQEYRKVWETETCFGHKYEDVCHPPLNSGLFTAMVEMGDVIGTFVGHDHVNDYEGTLHGIRLCYGRATGYNTYGREGFPRGARVIQIRQGGREFTSWIRLDDADVISKQPAHPPDGIRMAK